MAVGKEIKTKINSVANTQKITSAMQMVAASKMRRTQDKMSQGKPYSERIRGVIGHLANSNPEYKHIYMEARDIKRNDVVWIESRRGKIKLVVETQGRNRPVQGYTFVPFFDEGVFVNKLCLDVTCPMSKEQDFKKAAVKVYKA